MSYSKLISRICLLCFAGATAGVAAAQDSGLPEIFPRLNQAYPQLTVTDFDGDHELDLATDDSSRREDGGYLHRISLRLSQQPLNTFTVHTQVAARRLSARDVDGDSDRDLVLENDFREPIAVWLNDGLGNFSEGDVETFRYGLTHADPRSLSAPVRLPHLEQLGGCSQAGTIFPGSSRFALNLTGTTRAATAKVKPPSPDTSSSDSRGPPRNS